MNTDNEHLGDEIELYALGMLEDGERDRVDVHAGACAACATRLGRAESTVASMVAATLGFDASRSEPFESPSARSAVVEPRAPRAGIYEPPPQAAGSAERRAADPPSAGAARPASGASESRRRGAATNEPREAEPSSYEPRESSTPQGRFRSSLLESSVPPQTSTLAPRALRVLRSPVPWLAAAVVALAVVAASFAQQNARLRTDVGADGSAFHAMIDSHFIHAQFASPRGTPIAAKVVYERHGHWYEVLAQGIDPQSRVVVVHGKTIAGYPEPFTQRGGVLVLALPDFGVVRELRLVDSRGRITGKARLQLASEAPATN